MAKEENGKGCGVWGILEASVPSCQRRRWQKLEVNRVDLGQPQAWYLRTKVLSPPGLALTFLLESPGASRSSSPWVGMRRGPRAGELGQAAPAHQQGLPRGGTVLAPAVGPQLLAQGRG